MILYAASILHHFALDKFEYLFRGGFFRYSSRGLQSSFELHADFDKKAVSILAFTEG